MKLHTPRHNIEELTIDQVIFKQGFVPSCNLNICKGECCNLGVFMDLHFKNKILNFIDDIINVMTPGQEKDTALWFDTEIINDPDFTSGFAVGTNTYISPSGIEQCIFKDYNNHCSLQIAAEKNSLHKWDLKPTHCILYPLTINNATLTYDIDHSLHLSYCGFDKTENFTQPVVNAMEKEIKYIFGENAFKFLYDYYNNKFNQKKLWKNY